MTITTDSPNFLSNQNFLFKIEKLKHVHFFITEVNIPGITLPELREGTPFSNIKWHGDRVDFADLQITFRVDENLKSWYELFSWMQGLGFSEKFEQYAKIKDGKQTDLEGNPIRKQSVDGLKPKGLGDIFSHATLIVNTSHNNPNIEFTFIDCWPTSLSDLVFNVEATQEEYLTCTAVLKYDYYRVSLV